MATWIRKLWTRTQPSRPQRGWRPSLECLEDRDLLSGFLQINLVSDQANLALIQDPQLINAWGIGLSPTGGAFWVSDNNADVATLYNGGVNGSPFGKVPLVISIPGGAPTGQVFSGSANSFNVSTGPGGPSGPAIFVFASENGEITGWNPGVPPPAPSMQAQTGASIPDAVFKGLALGSNASGDFLFATDFFHGKVQVFDKNFQPVNLSGSFTDPNIPAGFAPFGIQNLGGKLFVTYALQNDMKHDDVAGPGNGFVSVFDTNGNFLQRLASNGTLNSPWGLALAPSNFGSFSNDLLVGNFGDGRINAFDPTTGAFLGQLSDSNGTPITNPGLWGLTFGNGVSAGDSSTLFFGAGPGDEQHGLFGSLQAMSATPLAGVGTNLSPTEGAAFTGVVASFGTGSSTATASSFTATITWGDAHTAPGTIVATSNGSFDVTGSNTYAEEGTNNVTVTVKDASNNMTTATSQAQVADAALAVTAMPVNVSQGVVVNTMTVATFTDASTPEAVGNYTATIDWGDGTTASTGTVTLTGTTFQVSGSHTFASPGRFTVTTTVHDEGGGSANASMGAVVGSAGERFLAQVYLNLFNRVIDDGGLSFWSGLLSQGVSHTQVALALESSAEFHMVQVQGLYMQLLHRAADMIGLNSDIQFLQAGGTVEQLAAILAGSAEYFQTRGGGTNSGFLAAIYQDFLNRSIDPQAQMAFMQALSSGVTPTQAAMAIIDSAEHFTLISQALYQQLLHRGIDATAQQAFVAALSLGVRDDLLRAILVGSGEYASSL